MTYTELIGNISTNVSLPSGKVKEVIESFSDEIIRASVRGEDVTIPNFGRFKTKVHAARKGRNPATGDIVNIPETKVTSFKLSAKVREEMKNA